MHPATPGHHGTLQTAPNSFRMRTYTIGVRNPCRFRTYETGLPQVIWNVHLRTGGWGGWGHIVNLGEKELLLPLPALDFQPSTLNLPAFPRPSCSFTAPSLD